MSTLISVLVIVYRCVLSPSVDYVAVAVAGVVPNLWASAMALSIVVTNNNRRWCAIYRHRLMMRMSIMMMPECVIVSVSVSLIQCSVSVGQC